RQTLTAYSSIEYKFRTQPVGPSVLWTTIIGVGSGEFSYADGKFCSEFASEKDGLRSHGYSAFDGNVYQTTHAPPALGVMGEVTRVPYCGCQPILMPFALFLEDSTRQDRIDLDTFRDAGIWSTIQEKVALGEPRQVDGHPCAIVKFERMPGPSHFELCL